MLGGVLKEMGVGVLRRKKCESQASHFSFASAKGRRAEVEVGRAECSVESHHEVCPIPALLAYPREFTGLEEMCACSPSSLSQEGMGL